MPPPALACPRAPRERPAFPDELIAKLGHSLNYSDDEEDGDDEGGSEDLPDDVVDDGDDGDDEDGDGDGDGDGYGDDGDGYDRSFDATRDEDFVGARSRSALSDLPPCDRSNLGSFQGLSTPDSSTAEKTLSVTIASEVSRSMDPTQMTTACPPPPPAAAAAAQMNNNSPPSQGSFPNLSDFRSAVQSSASVTDAAIAFQRWRHFRLKMMFSEELRKALEAARQDEARFISLKEEIERKEQYLMHALADSSQLRAQLSELENINKQQQCSSEIEILQEDLTKALERVDSAEDEAERHNREIRCLRERLKSTEDEAYRLGSELKATLAFYQKEKSGLVEENRVLLDQLARKDEEVVSQTQEINNLKSMLAGLRVSRPELIRLKTELQHSSKRKILHARFEEKENEEHHIPVERGTQPSEVQCLPKIQTDSDNHSIFPQLVDLLQKLVVCLEKSENSLDPCMKRVLPNENMGSSSPATDQGNSAHGNKRNQQVHNRSGMQQCGNSHGNKSLSSFCIADAKRNTFATTCWKWRWAASACEVQALSKELDTLRSLSKEVFEKYPFISGPMKPDHEKSSENNAFLKDQQDPLAFEKVFRLLASIWQTSAQSAHLENELNVKKRKLNQFLHFMNRWIQRSYRRRQIQKFVLRWLLSLLKSQRDKFKFQAAITKPSLSVVATASSKQQLSHTYTNSNRCSKLMKDTLETPEQQVHTVERTVHILKVVFHHKLEAMEDIILKEASAWHQKVFQERSHLTMKASKASSSAAAGLVTKICKELERCFSDACKETMVFFDVSKKDTCCPAENGKGKSSVRAISPKPMGGQVKVQTIKKTTRGKV